MYDVKFYVLLRISTGFKGWTLWHVELTYCELPVRVFSYVKHHVTACGQYARRLLKHGLFLDVHDSVTQKLTAKLNSNARSSITNLESC